MHGVAHRRPVRLLAALAASLFYLPLASRGDETARATTAPARAGVVMRLREFVRDQEAFEDSPASDRHAWLACDRLSRRIRDRELPEVEAFGVGPEAKKVRWLLAGILVQRNQFDAAAHVMVRALAEDPGDRGYRLGKWWGCNFEQRPDFREMSWKMTEGFLRQFERGTPEERLAIAEAFGKGPREVGMTAGQFRKAIGMPERRPVAAPGTKGS